MRSSYRWKVRGVRALGAAALLGAWLYLTGPGGASPLILPKVADVATELWAFVTSAELYSAFAVTFIELLIALSIAVVAGLGVGFWAARSELRAGVAEPLLVWSYLVPLILFYPLFLLWLGFGMPSKIGYAAVSAFSPIAFNSLRGFRRVDEKYVRVGRAFGASARQLDLSIKFRAGLPIAAAGIKLGAAVAMVTVIVAEMLGSSKGLGYLIKYNSESFNTAKTYAIILIVLVIVGIFYFVTQRLLREPEGTRIRSL
jgi:ABC-type nitrate/sulfonate/bicarbonate transport system permease component